MGDEDIDLDNLDEFIPMDEDLPPSDGSRYYSILLLKQRVNFSF
jgi:hypothetical protein